MKDGVFMRIFVIHDGDSGNSIIGYLFYYEKQEIFVAELSEDLDEWSAPLIFSGYVKRKIFTIPADISRLWVEDRIIPYERQNIGQILKTEKMTEYNEAGFLARSKGISSQDMCYVEEVEISDLPDWVKKRQADNIAECFYSGDNTITCLFIDDTVRKADLITLSDACPDVSHLIGYQKLLEEAMVDAGGYGIVFNDNIRIEKRLLIEKGMLLSVRAADFYAFSKRNVINTTEACELLGCTRQNLHYKVKKGLAMPLKIEEKENLYLRGEIMRSDRI